MNRSRLSIVGPFLLLGLAWQPLALGDSPSAEDREFFENKIRPVLAQHCYECHSADSDEVGGKLLLDSRDGILKGGESGPALVAGKPAASLIVQALRFDDLEMPPDQRLSEAVVRDFVKWVERGAPDPRSGDRAKKTDLAFDDYDEALWSFRHGRAAHPPEVRDSRWPRDAIDRFVLARIERIGLSPTRDANPRTLVRRLVYDLHGLPPTMEQVQDFEVAFARDGARAVEQLVDTLLAKPQFGQRWGRHWLDVARYAESNGDDGLGRNATFPHAWRYRDYVIDALNDDLPYDRFLTEQIAGDLLPAHSADQRNRQIVATGFLAIGSKPAAAMNKNFAMDIVDDQINVVGSAVMGLSVACARCHDHKHDPIPTRDYYALAGIFASTETLYGLAANEKLTAPPTDLHELQSVWNPSGAKKTAPDAAPQFPDSYRAAIDSLKPTIHARLDVAPDDLTVDPEVVFSPQGYAALKASAIRGRLTVSKDPATSEGPATSEDSAATEDSYAVAFWFKNELKNTARPITAYLFSRAEAGNKQLPGDHLGIGGTHDKSRTGKLFVFSGGAVKQSLAGTTVISSGTWNHVVLVRQGQHIRVFLNGGLAPEIEGELPAAYGDSTGYGVGSRSDSFAPLKGNLAELAVFARAITDAEAQLLHAASGQPRGVQSLGLAMGVRDKPKPLDCKIHINGETGKLGPSVPRGFLSAQSRDPAISAGKRKIADQTVGDQTVGDRTVGDRTVGDRTVGDRTVGDSAAWASQSGRRQLAAWLTRPDHPQTARVMVNRIWLHLFGRGIVATPDDFGVYGARPTHPELLDYLADRFVSEGWSVKRMIREIVLSHTYQLDSSCNEKLMRADPDNRLLARHSRRRLDAESLRDSMLQASGTLDQCPGQGSAIETTDALINWPPGAATSLHRPSNHRSIYLCMLRHAPPPELAAFDLPGAIGVTGRRNETTLPTQALFLLNSPFVVERADALARRIVGESQWDDARRVREIFRRTLQRDPGALEQEQAIEYVRTIEQAWASLCQALFVTSEFRYID